jgi:hypothetical protein
MGIYLAVQFNTTTNLFDTTPQFDSSLIYPSTPPSGQVLTAGGSISNGNLVSLVNSGSPPTSQVVLANASASCSVPTRLADGFVLSSYTSGQSVQVFLGGLYATIVPGATSANIGDLVYLSDSTPGGTSLTAPTPSAMWTATTSYSLGTTIIDTNGNWETVTTAGTSGGSEPSWPTSPCGATTTDGSGSGSPPTILTWTMSPSHYVQVVGTIVFFSAGVCTINFQPHLGVVGVTSVGLSMPSDFVVGNSPITTAGDITVAWASQNANYFHAGPTSGGAGAVTWRMIVAADLPGATISANGVITLAGDLGGTATSPSVISTHLASPLPVLQGGTGTATPSLIEGTNIVITGTWPDQVISATGIVGSAAWNTITSGTNTSATMVVGDGAILTFSGSGSPPAYGIINANELYGVVISGTPPTTGQVLTATSATTAEWTTIAGTGTVTSVSGAGIATGTVTTSGSITVEGSGDTDTAATAASNLGAAPAGDVVTADGSGNVQDSGFLLSHLTSFAVGVFAPGLSTASQIILYLTLAQSVTFPASATLSYANAITASTGTVVYTLYYNGTPFAAVTFTSSAMGTWVQASAQTFVPGDILEIECTSGGGDATLANVGITLAGTKN